MSISTLALIFLSLCVGAAVWLVFLWAVKRGEFDDPEGPKYRMLDEDDGPPRHPRKQGPPHDL
jgi:cbb3-type cytochrome oxidase maturation protein